MAALKQPEDLSGEERSRRVSRYDKILLAGFVSAGIGMFTAALAGNAHLVIVNGFIFLALALMR